MSHLPQIQNCEWRLSIYGRSPGEWDKLAKWIVGNKLFSHNVRWLIQVPRLYDVYKANGSIETFEDIVKSEFNAFFTFSLWDLDSLSQTYSNLYSRLPKTPLHILSSMSSSSELWVSTP